MSVCIEVGHPSPHASDQWDERSKRPEAMNRDVVQGDMCERKSTSWLLTPRLKELPITMPVLWSLFEYSGSGQDCTKWDETHLE